MNLRNQIIRGGSYLAFRQILGVIINFFGVLIIARLIGPQDYGNYVAASSILTYLQLVSVWGINVFIIRNEEENDSILNQSFTLLLLISVIVVIVSVSAIPFIQLWTKINNFRTSATWLFLSLPLTLLCQVPQAKLERNLDFKKLAATELTGMLTFYFSSLVFIFLGYKLAAPIMGWWLQQLIITATLYIKAKYKPRLYWDKKLVIQILQYGLGFSSSTWVWQIRELVPPLIVGKFLGAEAVAVISLTVRIVRGLSFVKEAMWRISMAGLAKLGNDRIRLKNAISYGMKLQVLGQGPLLSLFGMILIWVVPKLFGSEWTNIIQIYPFIALSFLTNALFNLHSSTLYVLKKNLKVMYSNIVHIVLFTSSAYIFVSNLGLIGYGVAEVIAIVSYFVIHYMVKEEVGKPEYRVVFIWWCAFSISLFVNQIGWVATLGIPLLFLWRKTWDELRTYYIQFKPQKRVEET